MAVLWRQKQLEYTFRRGLMRRYENFDICTLQAMQFAMQTLDLNFSEEETNNLLELYLNLNAYEDVVPALEQLKNNGFMMVAFSNGLRASLETLLTNANIIEYLEDIVSVDEIQTFKPNPSVYQHLAARTNSELSNCWVVSSNSFDVIGGKSAGINAAWIQRDKKNVFDTWEYTPDIIANDLLELCNKLV